jgi:N6-L-threonylcarbamoyladenine synthase
LAEAERKLLRLKQFSLPRPMLKSKDFNFSFAGLKTAVFYLIKKIGPLNKETKAKIALEFENAAIECLVYKTAKALEKYKIKTLIVAGGVAANKHLRNEMKNLTGHTEGQARRKIKLFFPTEELAGDNSLMIGIAGYLNYIKNRKKVPKLGSLKATGNLRL